MTETGKRNILLVTLILAVVTIPLKNTLNSYAIVLFCLAAAIQQPITIAFDRLKKDRYWKLSAFFFLWLGATWFWDSSGSFTIKNLEPSAAFLFLPVVLCIMPPLSARQLATICYSFIISVSVVCLICLIKSFFEYQQTHDSRVFFYHYLGYQMGLNAIYLSNYCIACIAWLLYFRFISTDDTFKRPGIVLTLAVCSFLFLMMFFLSSKLSLALLLALVFFMALYIGYRRKILQRSVAVLAIAALAALALSRNLGYLNWRISELKFKTYSGPQDDQNGLALRLTTWTSAIELIKEKPLLGYGLKGANEELVKKYAEKKFQMGIPEKYNSHNQFLETMLKSGIVGLCCLAALIIIPFIQSRRQHKFLLSLMTLHFTLVSMVEGTLEIQQELIFYWFFIFLFYYHYFPAHHKNAPARA